MTSITTTTSANGGDPGLRTRSATAATDLDEDVCDPWWDLVRVVLLVLACVVAARLVGRLDEVLGLTLLAGSVALLTAPVRMRLARHIPSGLATALTAVLTIGAAIAVSALLVRGLAGEADRLAGELTSRLDALRPGTLPDRVADALDARTSIEEIFSRIPSNVVTGRTGPAGVGGRAVDLLLVVILAAFLQSSASGILDRVVERWPRSARAEVRAFAADLVARGAGYARRVLLLAMVVWPFAAVAADLLDLPGAVVVGAWIALWTMVPWVGAWVGAAPFVALAAGDDWRRGVIAVGVAIVIAVSAGELRRRRVEHPTVELGAAATVLAFASGLAIGGFGGLVVCLTIVALLRAWSTSNHVIVRPSRSSTDEFETTSALSGTNGSPNTHQGLDAIVATTPTGVRLATGWRGALTLLGAVVGGALVWIGLTSLAPVTVSIVVAVLIAVALHRPVSWVERRARVPRFVAIAVISLAGLTVVGAATVFAVAGGAQTSSELSSQVPTIADDLSTLPLVGPWLEDRDASVWLENQIEDVPQRLGSGRDLADVLPSLGSRLLGAAWTLIFAAALLVDGPRLAAAVERRIPVRSRRQAVRLRDASHRAVGGYLAGAALVAMLNGLVVLGIAVALGIALAPVLAVWAFGWNFVPQIGGFMGGFPLIVLALAQGPTQAIAAGVIFVSYQFIENHLIQPAVISESIDVPPWVALLAALAGGAAAGLVGAVALTPLVGVVRVIVHQIHRDDFPGATVQAPSSESPAETDF